MDGNCKQTCDVGYFDAAGLGGQYIVVHPELDRVMTAHNASSAAGVWAGEGSQADGSFCKAYGAADYAPYLLAPRVAPTL